MQTLDPNADPSEVLVEENEFADAETFIQEEVSQLVTISHADFHVRTEAEADWVMNKIKGWENEREARAAAWKEQDNKLAKKIEWFEKRFRLELEEYATAVLAAQRGKKAKSFKLPCGAALGYRKQAKKVEVFDQQAYETWVLMNKPEAIVDYVPKIDKAQITEHAFNTGDTPAGCTLVQEHDKFYLKV